MRVIIFFFIFLISNSALTQVKKNSSLYQEILKVDSLLFQKAFNNCNTHVLTKIIASDIEFYHDVSGSIYGKDEFIKSIQNNICSLAYRPYRKLLKNSNNVYPLMSNGKVYGAIQSGIHEFYARGNNKEPYHTSTANFTHLWLKKNNTWELKRVLSYNHIIPNESINSQYSTSINKLLIKNNTPVVAIAILKNNHIESINVYGELKKGVKAPIDAVFNVASLTKPIVSMLVLKLVENRNWSLDLPLYNYWTDPDIKDNPYSKLLTTRHILSHQSGFKNWRAENKSGNLTFDFKPGTNFRYSGEGFEYLKKAIENKFNNKLEKLADSILFKPLKMKNTHFYWTQSIDESKFAKWHDQNGENSYKTYKNKKVSAADDLLTTISDYALFAEYILNGAELSKNLYKEMITQQNGLKNSIKMGLGWEILPNLKNDQYALLHTGSDIGVNTLIMLLPKTGEGIVVFTNGDNGKNLFFKIIEDNLSLGKQIIGKAE